MSAEKRQVDVGRRHSDTVGKRHSDGRRISDGGDVDARRTDVETLQLRREVLMLRKENSLLSGRTQVLREGVLLRFREQFLARSWQKRYFDLRISPEGGLTLRCFEMKGVKRQDGANGDLRMSITLPESMQILREAENEDPSSAEPVHCFQLQFAPETGPLKVLRLGSDDIEEVDAWIDTLEGAIAKDGSVSVHQVEAGPPAPAKTYDFSALRPVHRIVRQSVLTSEEGNGIPDCNVVGIVNLCVTVMVLIHIRLIVDNLRKHGLMLDTFRILFNTTADLGHLRCITVFWVGLPIFAAVALAVEKAACARQMSSLAAQMAHGFNCLLCLAVPIAVIRDTKATPTIGILVLVFSCTLFLKLVSYAHVNTALRLELRANQKKADKGDKPEEAADSNEVVYPANLDLGNMARFIAFPTLVYQTHYPRTQKIRKRWLLKRFAELAICLALMSVISEQFVLPTLRNFALPVLDWNVGQITIAILKIALPNVYLWLFMFYSLFHLWLNILAELTYFGDRLFYKEWWNATNVEDYWRLWNLPVHNWLVKHTFLPCVNAGCSKNVAVLVTFFVSAVFHELLVSVPCHTFRLWAFFGMMGQLPLVYITKALDKRLKGSQIGNQIFWVTFCILGQPLCVLLYFAQAQLGHGVEPP